MSNDITLAEVKDRLEQLRGKGRILLMTHERPDGDAVGSLCGMYLIAVFAPSTRHANPRALNSALRYFSFIPRRARLPATLPIIIVQTFAMVPIMNA